MANRSDDDGNVTYGTSSDDDGQRYVNGAPVNTIYGRERWFKPGGEDAPGPTYWRFNNQQEVDYAKQQGLNPQQFPDGTWGSPLHAVGAWSERNQNNSTLSKIGMSLPMVAMIAMGGVAAAEAAVAGGAASTGGGASVLPESYWSMTAGATPATATDAAITAAGSTGAGGGVVSAGELLGPTALEMGVPGATGYAAPYGSAGLMGPSALELGVPGATGYAAPYTAGGAGGMWSAASDLLKPSIAIPAGGQVLSALMGSGAAEDAAEAQTAAAGQAIGEQRRQYDLNRSDQAPFMQTGTEANQRLRTLLGLAPGAGSGDLVRKFTQADIDADPVYRSGLDFGLKEGRDGINARAIAGGGYDSGATLKALTKFGNDYGSTKANESYNRYTADNTGIYNKLAGVSGAGQTAAGQVAASGANMANNVSQSYGDIGNARAAGVVGGANAWGNAIGGINTTIQNNENRKILEQLLKTRGY